MPHNISKNVLVLLLLLSSSMHAISCQQTQKVQAFAERFYTVVLERKADNEGLDSWTNNLTSGKLTGADVADGFVFSQEYLDKNTSNEAYVQTLYHAFFNRNPDTDGYEIWIDKLNTGIKRKEILHGFLYSTEFINLSNSYGIKAYDGIALTAFVERFYTVVLGRASDKDGLKSWTEKLSTKVATGSDIAVGFIFSPEYNEANKTNTEYLTTLYRAFFDREADIAGFNEWMEMLSNGKSRKEVLQGFLHSQEFINLTNSFAILAYEGAPKPIDKTIDNESPVAKAEHRVQQGSDSIVFDANNSTDSDGNITCYWWSENANILDENITFVKDDFSGAKHNIRLTVVDDVGVSDSDSVIINYIDTTKPILVSNKNIIVPSNKFTEIRLIVRNNSPISYSIIRGDADKFIIDSTTGVITFKVMPDYEVQNTYTFILILTDSSNNQTIELITIKVTNSDEVPPVITLLGSNPQVIRLGNIYNELGATTNDGSIITIDSTDLNISIVGTYIVSYNAVDEADNVAVEKKRTIIVTPQAIKRTGQKLSYDTNGSNITSNNLKDDGYYKIGINPAYTRNQGLVTDTITHLEWQDNVNIKKQWIISAFDEKCQKNIATEPLCHNTSGDSASAYCSSLSLNGFTDWRLPTLDELVDIIDRSMYKPAINNIFQSVESNIYWTSDEVKHETQYNSAWAVDFTSGNYSREFKVYYHNVRCVRKER